jgi:hypothetical protein
MVRSPFQDARGILARGEPKSMSGMHGRPELPLIHRYNPAFDFAPPPTDINQRMLASLVAGLRFV